MPKPQDHTPVSLPVCVCVSACVFRYLHILKRGVRRGRESGCMMCASAKFVPKEILKINRIPLKSKPSKQQRGVEGLSADYTTPLSLPAWVYGSMATNQKFRLMRDHFHEAFAACPVEKTASTRKRTKQPQAGRQAGSHTELTDSAKTC